MTETDPFEQHLARSLDARATGVRAPGDVAGAARDRARRRRVGRVGVAAAVVGVVGVAVTAALVRPAGSVVLAPAAPPTSTAPAFAPCQDGDPPRVDPPTPGELASIADGGGVVGSLCRYTNPSSGDPTRDARSALVMQVPLDGGDTAAVAAAVLDADPVASPCAMIDSPVPDQLVVVLSTTEGLRSLPVPFEPCLGVGLAANPATGPEIPRETYAVMSVLSDVLQEAPADARPGRITGTVVLDGGPPGTAPAPVTSGTLHVVGDGTEQRVGIPSDGSFDVVLPAGTYEVYATVPQYLDGGRCNPSNPSTPRVTVTGDRATEVPITCQRR